MLSKIVSWVETQHLFYSFSKTHSIVDQSWVLTQPTRNWGAVPNQDLISGPSFNYVSVRFAIFMRYIVEPGIGVGPVRLEMTRGEVLEVMVQNPDSFLKSSDSRDETDAFHENCFQVFYDGETPRVVYIELSSGAALEAFYAGKDVFQTPADELVPIIAQSVPFDENDPELGYSFIFPDLEMSLWRPFLPESEDDEDGRFFMTIGIGIKGYYTQDVG